jgi:hypothetical protein
VAERGNSVLSFCAKLEKQCLLMGQCRGGNFASYDSSAVNPHSVRHTFDLSQS